jgi:hypothetical protein
MERLPSFNSIDFLMTILFFSYLLIFIAFISLDFCKFMNFNILELLNEDSEPSNLEAYLRPCGI